MIHIDLARHMIVTILGTIQGTIHGMRITAARPLEVMIRFMTSGDIVNVLDLPVNLAAITLPSLVGVAVLTVHSEVARQILENVTDLTRGILERVIDRISSIPVPVLLNTRKGIVVVPVPVPVPAPALQTTGRGIVMAGPVVPALQNTRKGVGIVHIVVHALQNT